MFQTTHLEKEIYGKSVDFRRKNNELGKMFEIISFCDLAMVSE